MNKHKKRAEHFRRLLTPHTNSLYKTAWRLTGNSDDAKDLVQDLLVKLYPKTDEMHKIELLWPWLKKALYRLFIDQQRKTARRPRNPDGQGLDPETMQSGNPGPEKLAEITADRQRLLAALDFLEPENRSLVLMHMVEGYTLSELEDVFGVSFQTLKTRLRRSKTRLKKFLQT